MGMFDSLYDAQDREWQTKAFACELDVYVIGDAIPADCAATFQVEVVRAEPSAINQLGRGERLTFFHSVATVRDGQLVAVDVPRDESLTLLGYDGRLVATPAKRGGELS